MSKSKQDYFSSFIKSAILDLKSNGICYLYDIEQVKELKKIIKREVVVKEIDCGISKGYSVSYK